ncbi:hypothetical protein [Rhodohalobacter sp. 8-1]|uniref:hypothetical protein n=1 Tax=Rhodohalobacter sp. 8-1 TaxID=3131972 RepID=UPI0030EEC442
MNFIKQIFRKSLLSNALSVLILVGLSGLVLPADAQDNQQMEEKVEMLQEMAPYDGYLQAHMNAQPQELLGGPLEVNISQNSGGVFVILPSKRELDPNVFGTPDMPRAFAGTPGINGLPPAARGVSNGEYTEMKNPSPFGDEHIVMANGNLNIEALDATAADASETEDEVQFMASWEDGQGNTYEVRCCEMLATHGVEFPTFGGVVTNTILHGASRVGTALMPTEYTYFAFWGMGQVLKNGDVLDQPRLIHGMLTEYVRKEGYELAFDNEVTAGRKHFHLMVPPMMPQMEQGNFVHKNVETGFELENGMQLPFWHVMFENLEINSSRQ